MKWSNLIWLALGSLWEPWLPLCLAHPLNPSFGPPFSLTHTLCARCAGAANCVINLVDSSVFGRNYWINNVRPGVLSKPSLREWCFLVLHARERACCHFVPHNHSVRVAILCPITTADQAVRSRRKAYARSPHIHIRTIPHTSRGTTSLRWGSHASHLFVLVSVSFLILCCGVLIAALGGV